ncbi:MAG: hypothetical protein HQM14_12405 [SAR324 cluster bacterium]|nr:hypothetical protein [SAR324 cluster bacterium]
MDSIIGIIFFMVILMLLGFVFLGLGKKNRRRGVRLEKEQDPHPSVFSDLEKKE